MLETGIPNLDLILRGSIPKGDVLLVVGPVGSGETALAMQMAFPTSSSGHSSLYRSTLAGPSVSVFDHFRHFSCFDQSGIGRRILLLNLHPLVSQHLDKVNEALVHVDKERHAGRLTWRMW